MCVFRAELLPREPAAQCGFAAGKHTVCVPHGHRLPAHARPVRVPQALRPCHGPRVLSQGQRAIFLKDSSHLHALFVILSVSPLKPK